MFMSFSNLIEAWILPPGLNVLLILFGFMISMYWVKSGKLIILIGCISLWLLSAPIVAYHFIDLLQNQFSILSLEKLNKSSSQEAIVILGGGDKVKPEYGNKRTVSDFTLHRVTYAAYLHQKINLPIIVSGGRPMPGMESEADLMEKLLKDQFNIITHYKEDQSLTTADESHFIADLMKQHGIKTIYLVTDAWHMPRSVYIFKCRGINVIPAPMGYYAYGPGYAFISYLPNINALHASTLTIHEIVGMAWYFMKYHKQCVA
jgi:uncharacterized SAM-binding protein YcdF (DUF218 family)